jgi:hypothetical protein
VIHLPQVNIVGRLQTSKAPFPPDDAVLRATDWSSFEPCPAASSA